MFEFLNASNLSSLTLSQPCLPQLSLRKTKNVCVYECVCVCCVPAGGGGGGGAGGGGVEGH